MQTEHGQAIADHWAKGDVYGLILSALERAGKSPESLSVEDLAPVDHFHARGLPPRSILPTSYPSRQTTTSSISVAALADQPATSQRAFSAASQASTSRRPSWRRPGSSRRSLA